MDSYSAKSTLNVDTSPSQTQRPIVILPQIQDLISLHDFNTVFYHVQFAHSFTFVTLLSSGVACNASQFVVVRF